MWPWNFDAVISHFCSLFPTAMVLVLTKCHYFSLKAWEVRNVTRDWNITEDKYRLFMSIHKFELCSKLGPCSTPQGCLKFVSSLWPSGSVLWSCSKWPDKQKQHVTIYTYIHIYGHNRFLQMVDNPSIKWSDSYGNPSMLRQLSPPFQWFDLFFFVFKMKLMKPAITVPHTSNYELVIIKLISGKWLNVSVVSHGLLE